MLYDVIEVKALPAFKVWVRFEDGLAGEVDLSELAGRGVFRRWTQYPSEFLQARVDPESGTVVWPGGLDIAPDRLYRDIAHSAPTASERSNE
jgi:hypothetical protein